MIVSIENFTLHRAGSFVVFEGINGVGKSTLLKGVADLLQKSCKDGADSPQVVTTREPGGTPLGVQLRKLLQETPDLSPDPIAELLMFSADRAEHVEKVIRPALKGGNTILCDRFFYSSVAFQGYGRGMDRLVIEKATEIATAGLRPHLVVLIDLEAEAAIQRAGNRQAVKSSIDIDRFESEDLAFHRRVRDGFLSQAKESRENFIVLDGKKPPEQLINQVFSIFK